MPVNHSSFDNANFPKDAQGRCYHVGIKEGEVANRIITVGDPCRAILLASLLDQGHQIDPKKYKEFLNYHVPGLMILTSKRLFTTVTGTYKGVPVSIVAIGMGTPMMDFFVREIRASVTGQLCIIRFGSCGALNKAEAGDIVVATESLMCTRNPDFFKAKQSAALSYTAFEELTSQHQGPYRFSLPSPANPDVSKLVS